MNFLIDAQLPRQLCYRLQAAGFDALHTLDLPGGNRTTDAEISAISVSDHRIVVTKDSDFVDSFVLLRKPWKLLLVSTGNIRNIELVALLAESLPAIANGFDTFDFIELTRANVVFHS